MMKTILAYLSLIPALAAAAGIDDAMNYKPKTEATSQGGVTPFTLQDIVDAIPNTLNERGAYVYGPDARTDAADYDKWSAFLENPRLAAFEADSFGKCTDFYFDASHMGWAKGVFENTLRFAFPVNESSKENASRAIRNGIDGLEKNASLGSSCIKRAEYTQRLKEVVNAILDQTSQIKSTSAQIIQAAKLQKTNDRNQQKAKEQSIQASRVASEKAADEMIQDAKRKQDACTASIAYKLYYVSNGVVGNNTSKESIQLSMKRLQEGAKNSGYLDKKAMADAGLQLADANQRSALWFAEYKKLGGKANSPTDVAVMNDPCK